MRCPTVDALPPPPAGKTGWPWTEASQPLPDRMPDGSEWPRISIVMPNYNYERYLETTIRSVLLQGYPNIEFIVEDGASKDGSVALIRRYERHLASWASEPDDGQPSAINRGLRRSTGTILAYINSDDYYLPNAFGVVAKAFHEQPEVDFIHGICRIVDENEGTTGEHLGSITRVDEVLDIWNVWWKKRYFIQPETFWRRRIWETVGDFRTDLYFVFDYEYWCRILLAGAIVRPVNAEIACFRNQPAQKTRHFKSLVDEQLGIIEKWLWDSKIPLPRAKRRVMQAQWTYDALFLKEAVQSVQLGEPRWKRWFRLLALSLRRPELFSCPDFQSHVANAIGFSGRARDKSLE
jgi:glycosyltransferase involved in cell wall biosynthesis